MFTARCESVFIVYNTMWKGFIVYSTMWKGF